MLVWVEALLWQETEALASLSVRELAKECHLGRDLLRVLEELDASVTSAGVIK